jgi:hypothetical protein
MTLFDNTGGLSRGTKILLLVLLLVVAGGVFFGAMLLADLHIALIASGVLLAAVVVPLVLYLIYLRIREKGRAKGMGGVLVQELGRKFFEGVDRFKKSDRDLYSVPWYVLVGEPGAGKTEAIRHANVCRASENDPKQGAGGTLNMDWWFAKGAVLLDTAGRLMFEASAEWREFLRLLKRHRRGCPLNGMILAIPANSLLFDTADSISSKASQIAMQFDAVQNELKVRFPVYVIVTKADLVPGFREFFSGATDPNSVNQMLGWSNPEALDQAFQPELVDKYLDSVRSRLKRRRATLLLEPKILDERSTRRIDQVDTLYTFPDNLRRIESRLRTYLETIFMPSEWSQKPLFVRGIYFTSSMGEGQVLDLDLAEAAGVAPTDVKTKLQIWARDRSFFLKDFFQEKAFAERGLVTGAANVAKHLKKRRLIMTIGGFSAAAVVLVGAIFGYLTLRDSIGRHYEHWKLAGEKTEETIAVVPAPTGAQQFTVSSPALDVQQHGMELWSEGGDKGGIQTPVIFYPFKVIADATENSRDAHKALFRRGVLAPLVRGAAVKLINEKAWGANDRQGVPDPKEVFGQLQLIAAHADQVKPQGGPLPPVDVDKIARFVLNDKDLAALNSKISGSVKSGLAKLYTSDPDHVWVDLFGTKGNDLLIAEFDSLLNQDIEALGRYNTREIVERLKQMQTLVEALEAYRDAENDFIKSAIARTPKGDLSITDTEGYKGLQQRWSAGLTKIRTTRQPVEEALQAPKNDSIGEKLKSTSLRKLYDEIKTARQQLKTVYAQMAQTTPSTEPLPRFTATIKNKLSEIDTKLSGQSDPVIQALARHPLDDLYRDVLEPASGPVASAADGGTPQAVWAYFSRCETYDRVQKAMAETEMAGADGADENPDLKNLFSKASRASSLQFSSLSSSADAKSFDSRAAAVISDAANARDAASRTLLWKQLLKAAESRIENLKTVQAKPLPTIPFTGMTGQALEYRLTGPAVSSVLTPWSRLMEYWSASHDTLLDRKAIETDIGWREYSIQKYLYEVLKKWMSEVPASLAPQVSELDWSKFQKTLHSADSAGEINDGLQKISELGAAALTAVKAGYKPAKPDSSIDTSIAMYSRGVSAMEGQSTRDKYEALFRGWRGLGVAVGGGDNSDYDAAEGRAKLLALDATAFDKLFVFVQPESEHLAQRYWSKVGMDGIGLLRKATPEVRAALVRQIKLQAAEFPVSEAVLKNELGPKEVDALKKLLDSLDPPIDPKADRPSPTNDSVKSALNEIRSGPTPDRVTDDYIARVHHIVDYLSAGPIIVEIRLMEGEGRNWRKIRLDSDRQGEEKNIPPAEKGDDLGMVRMPGAPATFQLFGFVGDQQPNFSVVWSGKWPALKAILDRNSTTQFDEARKVARVQMHVKDGNKTEELTLVLKFDRQVPPLSDWKPLKQ